MWYDGAGLTSADSESELSPVFLPADLPASMCDLEAPNSAPMRCVHG
jgi:hypothetical protein